MKKQLKYHFKILFGNNLNFCVFVTCYAFIFCFLIQKAIRAGIYGRNEIESLTERIMCVSYIHFPVMFLISMNFFSSAQNIFFEETLKTAGVYKREWNQFLVLNILNVVISLILIMITTFSCFSRNVFSFRYYVSSVIHVAYDFYLVGVLAVLLGMLLSCIRIYSIRILGFVFLNFLLGYPFTWICKNVLLWPLKPYHEAANMIMELIWLLPDGLMTATDYYGCHVVQPHKILLMMLWLSAVSTLLLLLKRKYGLQKYYAVLFGNVVVFALCFWGAVQPYTKIVSLGQRSYNKYMIKTYEYDQGIGRREEAADFKVLSYDMNLNAYLNLDAQVTAFVDKGDLPEYKFTLFREYHLKEVKDQTGERLDFEQDGDYIIVYPDKEPVEKLTFNFGGSGTPFYSEISGIALPAGIPFYPIAGFWPIYAKDTYYDVELYNEIHIPETSFHVRVNTLGKVYSSLKRIGEKNEFEGNCDGFFLLSGIVFEKEYKGITFYYHYGSSLASCEDQEAHLDKFIEMMDSVLHDNGLEGVEGKTIFIKWPDMYSDIIQVYDDFIGVLDTDSSLSFKNEYQKFFDFKNGIEDDTGREQK